MSPMPTPPPLQDDPLRIEICSDEADLARHAASLFATLAGRALSFMCASGVLIAYDKR